MDPRLRITIIVAFIYFLSSLAIPHPASSWTHQNIWMKNEQGRRITPEVNSTDPYSPRHTCGGCHDYSVITRGYHFSQGFDEMSDRYNSKRPWILSPGFYGKACFSGTMFTRVARKAKSDPKEGGIPIYDWIAAGGKLNLKAGIKLEACGWYMPGGGPLEYSRKTDGKADLTMSLIEGERMNMYALDGDFSSFLTPDRRSHFKDSGVIEADCLICHMPNYRMNDRNSQLDSRNFRWAATAGAGLGQIRGNIFTYKKPSAGFEEEDFLAGSWNFSKRPYVAYHWGKKDIFTNSGKLKGALISRSVNSNSCLQCHGSHDGWKTGMIYSPQHDAHARWGFQCIDCHGLMGKRLEHQIARGRSPDTHAQDDLKGAGIMTCRNCHQEGKYKPTRTGMPKEARNPAKVHLERFSKGLFHLTRISCTACHSTAQPGRGGYLGDMSMGRQYWYTADNEDGALTADDFSKPAKEPWKPWMMHLDRGRSDEKYIPRVPKVLQWFGEKMANGEIRPISLTHVHQALKRAKGISTAEINTTDGRRIKRPTIATEEDMKLGIKALTDGGYHNVVFVGDRVYEVRNGDVLAMEDPMRTRSLSFPVYHNVTPIKKKMTYGAKGYPEGCADCHAGNAAFFTKMNVKNIGRFLKNDYPALKEPDSEMQMKEWGKQSVPVYK
ncbi:MAG TPA: hypothetical protein VMT12_12160 [Syntrophales bacterium]|nr:hypothetical protein [Syntrophales bacterium]